MDYVDGYEYFVPYRYDFTVSYSIEEYEELYQAFLDAHDDGFEGDQPYPPSIEINLIDAGGAGSQLVSGKNVITFSNYQDFDSDAYYFKT